MFSLGGWQSVWSGFVLDSIGLKVSPFTLIPSGASLLLRLCPDSIINSCVVVCLPIDCVYFCIAILPTAKTGHGRMLNDRGCKWLKVQGMTASVKDHFGISQS